MELRKSLNGTFINAISRIQWLEAAIPNPPRTFALNITHFSPKKNAVGNHFWGGYFFYDEAGAFRTYNLSFKIWTLFRK